MADIKTIKQSARSAGNTTVTQSEAAIIHFDDMQKTHPFTYLPNKFLKTRRKP